MPLCYEDPFSYSKYSVPVFQKGLCVACFGENNTWLLTVHFFHALRLWEATDCRAHLRQHVVYGRHLCSHVWVVQLWVHFGSLLLVVAVMSLSSPQLISTYWWMTCFQSYTDNQRFQDCWILCITFFEIIIALTDNRCTGRNKYEFFYYDNLNHLIYNLCGIFVIGTLNESYFKHLYTYKTEP